MIKFNVYKMVPSNVSFISCCIMVELIGIIHLTSV